MEGRGQWVRDGKKFQITKKREGNNWAISSKRIKIIGTKHKNDEIQAGKRGKEKKDAKPERMGGGGGSTGTEQCRATGEADFGVFWGGKNTRKGGSK